MQQQYRIIEFGKAGKFQDFPCAILVKVVSVDNFEEYQSIKNNPAYEEEIMQMEEWLMFKKYPGKYMWISEKAEKSNEGNVWYLDLNNDFILYSCEFSDPNTGDEFMRSVYKVVMVNSELDIVEAKEKGISYKGRTGTQKHLDELNLPLEGEEDFQYYIIGRGKDGEFYGIPYDYEDENSHGMFKADEIKINPYNGHITLVKSKVGVYNPMLGQFYKFAN